MDYNEFKESLRLWNNQNAIYHENRIIDTCFRKSRPSIFQEKSIFSHSYTPLTSVYRLIYFCFAFIRLIVT